MAGKNTAAFGIYHSEESLRTGINTLAHAGFRETDVSVLVPENVGTKDFAHEKATKAPEGATTGGASGAVVGGVLGWLAGVGSIAIPGIGPFIAAGPILAALAGIGVGSVTGGLVGALVGAGIPEYEAKRYEGMIRKGGFLVSVHCDNSEWTSKAKEILERTGADDVSSTGESSADFAEGDKPTRRTHL
jgi:ActD protein